MAGKTPFRVIIVGGGVAGLTLANALEQAEVDYVLLERRPEFAPQVGASIGVFPNGARILDQLGAWWAYEKAAVILNYQTNQDEKGRPYGPILDPNSLSRARSGYYFAWGDRQILLETLYDNLRDKSKALAGKEVVDVTHTSYGVIVRCSDTSSYQADVLVGADGVFSKTRTQMWELAEHDHPALVKHDRTCLAAEYNCLFGIAKGIHHEGLKPGNFIQTFGEHRCALLIAGENGRVWYFAQERLGNTYGLGNIPRYTTTDTEAFVRRNADLSIQPGLTLADLWTATISSRLVAIEEAKFKLWTWGRIACLGDSVHKATPNLASGGNAAIESAAALANELKALSDECRGAHPTEAQIGARLQKYQADRQVRAEAIVVASAQLCRLHNRQGMAERFFVSYILPYFGEFLVEMAGEMMLGAVKLDFLPIPIASVRGTRPFNPSQGYSRNESRLRRALVALPIIALAGLAYWSMNVQPSLPWAQAVLDRGRVVLDSGPVPILKSFYQAKGFDEFLALINVYFFPSLYGYDPVSRRQVLIFFADGTVLLAIWMFESIRRANFLTFMQFPSLLAFAGQFVSIGLVSPLYCFLSYTLTPVEKFSATDLRMTRRNWTPAVLPVVLLCYVLPLIAMYFWPDMYGRQVILFIWQPYPVWSSLTFWLFSKAFTDTTDEDKLTAPKADIPIIRRTMAAAIILAAATWTYFCTLGPYSAWEIFVPQSLPQSTGDITAFAREFLRLDYAFTFSAHALWLLYLFGDLKQAGMLSASWSRIALYGAVSVAVLGPGATLGLAWLWREDVIANKRHKDALTEERAAAFGGLVDTKKAFLAGHGNGAA